MIRVRAVLLVIIAAALILAGCQPQPVLKLPPGAKVLRLAANDDVPTLDPALGYDTASWTFEQAIFDTLVRYADTSVKLVPDLALKWTVSPDAKTLTFHLRHNARFSNGQPVTSADVRYSIERVLRPSTRSQGMQYYRDIVGADAFIAGSAPHVSGILIPGPYTIVFKLTHSDPIFIDKLAMPFAAAVPKAVVKRWGDDFSRHVIGSGAFKLKTWRRGQYLLLVRNPYYFVPGEPKLDAIFEEVGASEELQWLQFQAGQIDISSIPPAEFPYVMNTPKLKALTVKSITMTTDYLGMNCQMAPFNDVRVRRAFNYAINKKKLLKLLNGRGVVARGVLPPELPGYDPALTGYPYDPAKARKLLEEAGIKRDFRPVLWMRADQTMLMLAQSIQQDLELLGIDLQLKPVAWGPLLEAVRQPHTVDLFLLGWEADFPDPENFLSVLFSKGQWGFNNDTFYYNPKVQALLAKASPIADLSQRFALYDQAERIIVDDAPWVFLYHPVTYVIRQPWVHGLQLNPMRPMRLEKIRLSARSRRG